MQITCELQSYEYVGVNIGVQPKANIKMRFATTNTATAGDYIELFINDEKHLISLPQLATAVNSLESCYGRY